MWRAAGRDYLVTNWHVLSMRNFFAPEKNLRSDGGRPNRLRAMFNVKTGSFARHRLEFSIRDEDHRPLWLVHCNRKVDIAVLPVEVAARPINDPNHPFRLPLYPINELANAKLRIAIGMEVFILGYPFDIELPGYPVWKRGSIASEPELASLASALGSAVKQSEYMLVDTASRPGMSGAPVIRRSWSNHDIEPDFVATVDTPIDRFIGVYSGRAHTDHPEAQIGLVWNGSLIEEIIAGNRRDAD
jgi:Trypsin-like peptidase domain